MQSNPDKTGFYSAGHLFLLLSVILAPDIVYMPSQHYEGDSRAIKLEAINLVHNRQLGIPADKQEDIAVFLATENQFYVRNSKNGMWHNR